MSRSTRRDSRRDTGRSSVLEAKRSGMGLFLKHLKENVTLQPLKWWKDSRYRITNPSSSRKLLAKSQIQTQTKGKQGCWSIVACGLHRHKRKFFSRRVSVVHNEAVIKMIVKRRSPTMRHVSRTHRVALDWLFDRINLDPTIQIKYVDTKKQLAYALTKESLTRDEWNHLLRLSNIMNFSMFSCSHSLRIESRVSCLRELRKALPKRVRQWRNRDRWVRCQGTSWAQRKPIRKIRVLRTTRRIKSWIKVLFHRASGNWCETATKTQQHILKSGGALVFWHQETGAEW